MQETGILTRIALPPVAAYIAEFVMFATTKILVGQHGFVELAAVGLAGDLTFELLAVVMGLFSVVGVLVAQAEGANDKPRAGLVARQGFILATGIGVATTILVWNLGLFMELMGQDPRVYDGAVPYLHALAPTIIPALWFSVVRTVIAALAKTTIIMVITVLAVGINYVLTYGLLNGAFGLPALGIAGAGWASSIVHWVMFLSLIVAVYCTPGYRGYGFFKGRIEVSVKICREILHLGMPVAALTMLEVGLFTSVSLLSGIISITALAAYQVLFGWIGLAFMFAHGIAEATMVRVAHAVGRNSPIGSRRAGMIGMSMVVILLCSMVIVPLTLPNVLIQLFLDPADPGFDAVKRLVTSLLIIVALFQIFDGLQIVSSMALRGIKDTVTPMWIAAIGYIILGLGGGCVLAFPLNMGATGLWWGLALGLIVTSTVLAFRFNKLTSRRQG